MGATIKEVPRLRCLAYAVAENRRYMLGARGRGVVEVCILFVPPRLVLLYLLRYYPCTGDILLCWYRRE